MRLLGARSLQAAPRRSRSEPPRTLVFRHDERRLAGWLDLTAPDPGPLTVRLEPWAEIAGRLVNAEGQPLPRTVLRPRVAASHGWAAAPSTSTRPGSNRSRWPIPHRGISPGLPYGAVLRGSNGLISNRSIAVAPTQAGETRELGDIQGMRVP